MFLSFVSQVGSSVVYIICEGRGGHSAFQSVELWVWAAVEAVGWSALLTLPSAGVLSPGINHPASVLPCLHPQLHGGTPIRCKKVHWLLSTVNLTRTAQSCLLLHLTVLTYAVGASSKIKSRCFAWPHVSCSACEGQERTGICPTQCCSLTVSLCCGITVCHLGQILINSCVVS